MRGGELIRVGRDLKPWAASDVRRVARKQLRGVHLNQNQDTADARPADEGRGGGEEAGAADDLRCCRTCAMKWVIASWDASPLNRYVRSSVTTMSRGTCAGSTPKRSMMAVEEECTRPKTASRACAAAAEENMEGTECLALKSMTLGWRVDMKAARESSSRRATEPEDEADMTGGGEWRQRMRQR